MTDKKLGKWLKWMDIIFGECQNLVIKKYHYDEYLKIVKSNPFIGTPDDFHQWAARNYYESALMGIRRLLDDHKDAVSLSKLLKELMDSPKTLSLSWYMKQCPNRDDSFGPCSTIGNLHKEPFLKMCNVNEEVLAASKICEDLNTLNHELKKLEDFIDNTLAHKNKGKKGLISVETRHIDSAIKSIEDITIKYLVLFCKGGYEQLCPVFQYDWMEIFQKPWIEKG